MAPRISILLPSLRPELARLRVADFARTSPGVNYEIVIVSPFPIDGPRVVHVYEAERNGTACATNAALEAARGQYVIYWADDAIPVANCLREMLRFMQGKQEPFLGSFAQMGPGGMAAPHNAAYGKLYACYGCISRKGLEIVGNLFDPRYRSYYTDVDLSMRVWQAGGSIGVCSSAWLVVNDEIDWLKSESTIAYTEKDAQCFMDRWHETLGAGYPRDPAAFNVLLPARATPMPHPLSISMRDPMYKRVAVGWTKSKFQRIRDELGSVIGKFARK